MALVNEIVTFIGWLDSNDFMIVCGYSLYNDVKLIIVIEEILFIYRKSIADICSVENELINPGWTACVHSLYL